MKKKTGQQVFAIDLGGTWIKGALIDNDGRVLLRGKKLTEAERGAKHIVANIAALVGKFSKKAGAMASSLGVGVPAVVRSKEGIIVSAPNLPLLDGINIKKLLQAETGLKVRIENDANCAALGEGWLGSASDKKNFILFTLGTGVGGGIVLGGKLWTGDAGRAAEIGHLLVEPGGFACGCGSQGCLETISSLRGIQNMLQQKAGGKWYAKQIAGKDPDRYPEIIGTLARHGDSEAKAIVSRFGRGLGLAVANLLNVLDIRTIVFGGGIANMFDLFEEEIRQQVKNCVYAFSLDQLTLLKAARSEDAGILGAAKLALGH